MFSQWILVEQDVGFHNLQIDFLETPISHVIYDIMEVVEMTSWK